LGINHFLVWEWGGGGGEENVYDFDRKKFLTLFLAKHRYFVHGLKFVLNDSVKKTHLIHYERKKCLVKICRKNIALSIRKSNDLL
jgi:hypothetical protein